MSDSNEQLEIKCTSYVLLLVSQLQAQLTYTRDRYTSSLDCFPTNKEMNDISLWFTLLLSLLEKDQLSDYLWQIKSTPVHSNQVLFRISLERQIILDQSKYCTICLQMKSVWQEWFSPPVSKRTHFTTFSSRESCI